MRKAITTTFAVLSFFLAVFLLGVVFSLEYFPREIVYYNSATPLPLKNNSYNPELEHERAIISVVEKTSPAVVNIVVSKEVTPRRFFLEDFFGTSEQQTGELERVNIGSGTGFIISDDGIIVTNRHVVSGTDADYDVFLLDGTRYTGKVLAKDPTQDLAVMKIDGEDLPTVVIGNSDTVRIGQTAIAIGNALGELKNTVSVGVISGVGRSVAARGGMTTELLDDVIQTDAAINLGNSGGPLINLKGEVVAINTATAINAEGVGFAIPINRAKRAIEGVLKEGRIIYPLIGVRYRMVNQEVISSMNLVVDYGAVIISGEGGQPAITPNSGAEKAGLKEGDIILKIDEQRIDEGSPLGRVIVSYYPGDEVMVTILRNKEEKQVKVVLGEM